MNGGDTVNLKDIIEEYEKTIIKRKNSVVHFPVVAYDDGIDMSRVYPTKQNIVKNIVIGGLSVKLI